LLGFDNDGFFSVAGHGTPMTQSRQPRAGDGGGCYGVIASTVTPEPAGISWYGYLHYFIFREPSTQGSTCAVDRAAGR
jgi:hypothetical protein